MSQGGSENILEMVLFQHSAELPLASPLGKALRKLRQPPGEL